MIMKPWYILINLDGVTFSNVLIYLVDSSTMI